MEFEVVVTGTTESPKMIIIKFTYHNIGKYNIFMMRVDIIRTFGHATLK